MGQLCCLNKSFRMNAMNKRFYLIASLALALLLPIGAFAQQAAMSVMIVGSSSVNGAFGRLIESELSKHGANVARHGKSSSGLARPDFLDWQSEIARLGNIQGKVIVVMMGGNDTQSLTKRMPEAARRRPREEVEVQWNDEAAWTNAYAGRMREFVDGLCRGGARRVVVVLPNNGDRARWAQKIARVQAAQAQGVRGSACGVMVDTRLGGTRETMDGVHLTRDGARDVYRHIETNLLQSVGVRPQ